MMDDFTFLEFFGEINEAYIGEAMKPWKKERYTVLKKSIMIAACVGLVILFGLINAFPKETKAYWEKITTKISKVLRNIQDVEKYSDVIGKSVTKDGLTITLEEVVLDNEEMLVSYTLSYDEKEYEDIVMDGEAWINENKITSREEYSMGLEEQLPEVHKVSCFRFSSSYIKENSSKIRIVFHPKVLDADKILGEFCFDFSAGKDELLNETICVPLDYNVRLNEETILHFSEFSKNSVTSTLKGVCENLPSELNGCWLELYLQGSDNLGNPLKYREAGYAKPDINFVLDKLESKLDKNAEYISLQTYVRYHPLGEQDEVEFYTESDADDKKRFISEDSFSMGNEEVSSETAIPIGEKMVIRFTNK